VVFVAFFFVSMPERSNEKEWKDGWLGARVYQRTKEWRRGDEAGEAALAGRMAGDWVAPGGYRFTIERDAIRMKSGAEVVEWSPRTCRHRFRIDYDFAFRSALEWPIPDGLAFTSFDQVRARPAISLPDRRFPRLTCACDGAEATWVLIDVDKLTRHEFFLKRLR